MRRRAWYKVGIRMPTAAPRWGRLAGHWGGTSAAFSPDVKRIVTASQDKTARLWDADSGAALRRLAGHWEGVTSSAFSPDGEHIVTETKRRAGGMPTAGVELHRLGHDGVGRQRGLSRRLFGRHDPV